MAGSFALSLAALDVLLEQFGLGPAPFPFEIPHHGRTREERAEVRAAVAAELEREDLTGEAAEAVRLLAGSRIAISVFGRLDGGPLFARICASGRRAIAAVSRMGSVHFERIRPTALVPAAVGLLPGGRAGSGQPVTISPVPEAHDGVTRAVRTPATQLYKARTMLAGNKVRLGQFRVAAGGRHEPDLFWFDTAAGRYVLTSGPVWTTISPADNGRVERFLSAQLARLTGAR